MRRRRCAQPTDNLGPTMASSPTVDADTSNGSDGDLPL